MRTTKDEIPMVVIHGKAPSCSISLGLQEVGAGNNPSLTLPSFLPASSEEEAENSGEISKDSGISTGSSGSIGKRGPVAGRGRLSDQEEPQPGTSHGSRSSSLSPNRILFLPDSDDSTDPSHFLFSPLYSGDDVSLDNELRTGVTRVPTKSLGENFAAHSSPFSSRPSHLEALGSDPMAAGSDSRLHPPGAGLRLAPEFLGSERVHGPSSQPCPTSSPTQLQTLGVARTYPKGTLVHVCRCGQKRSDRPTDLTMYLTGAISMCFLFPPLGFIALYYTLKSLRLHRAGDVQKGREAICYAFRTMMAGSVVLVIMALTATGIISFIHFHEAYQRRETIKPAVRFNIPRTSVSHGDEILNKMKDKKIVSKKESHKIHLKDVFDKRHRGGTLSARPPPAPHPGPVTPPGTSNPRTLPPDSLASSEPMGGRTLYPAWSPGIPVQPGGRGSLFHGGLPLQQGLAAIRTSYRATGRYAQEESLMSIAKQFSES